MVPLIGGRYLEEGCWWQERPYFILFGTLPRKFTISEKNRITDSHTVVDIRIAPTTCFHQSAFGAVTFTMLFHYRYKTSSYFITFSSVAVPQDLYIKICTILL